MVDTKELETLSHLAAQLNSTTDKLNEHIEQLNQILANLNIGLEYYRLDVLEGTGMLKDSSQSPARKYEINTYLGYDKIEDKWQLALKDVTTEYEWDADERAEFPVTEYDYTPLRKASRDLRLKAVNQFDVLISELQRQIQRKLDTIQKAEEIAKITHDPVTPVKEPLTLREALSWYPKPDGSAQVKRGSNK